MISRDVEISIAGGVVAMVCVLSLGLFFFFFCNHVFIVLRYKKPHAALVIAKTKTYKQSNCPLHLFMGKIKHPESIGKVPLA